MKTISTLFLLGCAALGLPAFGANWPNWRGPTGDGVSAESKLPLNWSDQENVRWRVELPGAGNSSPIAWGDRVFLSQFVDKANQRALMAFDRATGRLVWQSGVAYAESEPTQESNPYCAGTPATDGKRVYVCFGSAGVYAYDFGGKEVWHRDLGRINHMFGSAVSPLLHGGLCILNFGPGDKSRLVALNKETGATAWEAEPPKVDPGEQGQPGGRGGFGGPGGGPGGPGRFGGPGDDGPGGPGGPGGGRGRGRRGGFGGGGPPNGSWSTPVVINAGEHQEIIVAFPNRLAAYAPDTGKLLWTSKGLGSQTHATPVLGDGMLVALSSGMGRGNAIAVKPGGSGDVSESQRVWSLDRVKAGMASGVVRDGYFYCISQQGVAFCLELKTGNTIWEERLKGPGARGSSWSSLLLAGDKIYVPNQAGDIFVLRASPKFEILATNSVGEPSNASLAASEGELFFRTDKALWCFRNKE